MAAIPENEKEELACVYAALILHDQGMPVTADKLTTLAKAAGVKLQAFWPAVFARTLQGKNIDDLIFSVGSAPAAAAPAAAAPAEEAKGDDKKKGGDKKKEEKKEKKEEKEEEEADMGLSLFD